MNVPNARAVELEILYNGLLSVADESFQVLNQWQSRLDALARHSAQ